jgi:hypothetical protein
MTRFVSELKEDWQFETAGWNSYVALLNGVVVRRICRRRLVLNHAVSRNNRTAMREILSEPKQRFRILTRLGS